MAYLSIIDADNDICVILGWGRINMEMLNQMAEEFEHSRPRDVILVYQDIEGSDLSVEELQAYAEAANESLLRHDRTDLRTCVVVKDPLLFGVNRQFGTIAEMESYNPDLIRYYTCETLDQGAQWLGHDVGYLKNQLGLLEALRQSGKV